MSGLDFKDFYRILGVPRSATKEDLRRARRELLKESHPDNIVNDTEARAKAEERSKLINEAFYVLSNPERRSEYDSLYTRRQEGVRNREYYSDEQKHERTNQRSRVPDYQTMVEDWQSTWEKTSSQWQNEWEETLENWDKQYREQLGQFDPRNREIHRENPDQENRKVYPEKKNIRFGRVTSPEVRHHLRWEEVKREERGEEPVEGHHIKFGRDEERGGGEKRG